MIILLISNCINQKIINFIIKIVCFIIFILNNIRDISDPAPDGVAKPGCWSGF